MQVGFPSGVMTRPLEMTDEDFDPDPELVSDRRHHLTMLIVMLIVIGLSFVLDVAPETRVNVSGLPNLPLPELCLSRSMFGVQCPGCGLTRSFIHLAEGQFAKSIAIHRVGWLLAFAVVLQVPYRIHRLRHQNQATPKWTRVFSYVLIVALIGNWLLLNLGI